MWASRNPESYIIKKQILAGCIKSSVYSNTEANDKVSKKELGVYEIVVCALALVALIYTWKILNWAYIRPKRLEKALRKQGLNGNSYKLVYGDFKEMMQSITESRASPINLHDDIKPRVQSFFLKTVQKYGKESFFWLGANPSVILTDPELIKEVMNKSYLYLKPKNRNPLTKLLAQGVVSYEKQKWAKHRKIIDRS